MSLGCTRELTGFVFFLPRGKTKASSATGKKEKKKKRAKGKKGKKDKKKKKKKKKGPMVGCLMLLKLFLKFQVHLTTHQ